MKFPIYLDSHATTPLDPRVLDSMMPYLTEKFGNASSLDHSFGHETSVAVEESREKIAKAINADSGEIVFTSGATESDNLALTGVLQKTEKKHLITCVTEHSAILDTAKYLESTGIKVTYLKVDKFGIIDLDELREAITSDTALVSIMAANNEIGTIQNIAEIGKITHENNILFHTDGAQAVGHIPIDVKKCNIDLMSFSSHKIHGSKGIGALYVRSITPRVKLGAMIHGGGQEKNIRSGTLNVPGIVGFGKAVEIALDEMEEENKRFKEWNKIMLNSFEEIGGILNGHPEKRLAHNLNTSFPSVDGKAIINSISKEIAISAGSACTTQSVEPSHVLLALGLSEAQAHSSIRIGLGRFNTKEEVDYATSKIIKAVETLKKMSV